MRRRLVAAIVLAVAAALTVAPAQAKVRNDGRQPRPEPEVVGDAPSTVVVLDGEGRAVESRTFAANRQGPVWTCAYLAVKAVAGSTPEIGLDILRGPMTPGAADLVALSCYADGALAHQEILEYDRAEPLGAIGIAADTTGLARRVAAGLATDPAAPPADAPAPLPSPPRPAP